MKHRYLIPAFAILILSVFPLGAQIRQELDPTLQTQVVSKAFSSDATPSAFRFNDSFHATGPSSCEIKTDADGKPLLDVDVKTAGRSQYAVSLQYKTTGDIHRGDVLLIRMTMRTLAARQESGESVIYFSFQDEPGGNRMINTILGTGASWKTFNIPVKAHRDMGPGGASVVFFLSSLVQHVEITGLEILNFGPSMDMARLPETRFTYNGREEGAAWREEALKRIEELRTAPIKVRVVDAKGRPVRNAEVSVKMVRSDFLWGTSVSERYTSGKDSVSATYREKLKELFNAATVENGFKSGGWSWSDDRKINTLEAFEWLEQNGFRQRGHNLVWPGWKFNPRMTRYIAEHESQEVFDRFIKAQMYERIALTKGRVYGWDVVNEYMHEKDFFKYLPTSVMVDWFKLARELDPDADLYINEYAMLNCVQSPDNIKEYSDTIAALLAKGAPIDAIGIQGHVGRQPRDPELVISDLDLLKPLGLPVQITEFDINTPDEELQADYLRDFLIAVYSHPLITGVTLWGFWEGAHWKRDAAFYRMNWTPKKTAATWLGLVKGEWFTSFLGKTGKNGEVETRGHFGEYQLTVSYKGQVKEASFCLTKEGDVLTIGL